ncbi:DsbA family protein [Rubricoccus marinus]|uniref:Thioredoxin domain-containing protein n=1 Tax=Rubricoccus marinus TaxID=716817 RepID=A0A259TVR2_9BACT|nr:thioredoxin domain-containing protein [Rubricoccus marinus]OZC01638.1 hypothetical protein BSZ36_00755 [Rubricoccus marinus]
MPTLRALSLAFLATFVVACGPANSQTASGGEDRKAQIIANLKHEFPQVADLDVRIDTLKAAADGMDEGTFLIAGQPPQPFLVTRDNSAMYLIASDPIDVSRSVEELAEARANADSEAEAEARVRSAALASSVAGLPARGPADAPVTIVEFSDFQCPYCSRAAGTVKQVLAAYPEDVKLVYAHFPLGNHPWARPAAIASSCAAEQNNDAFWTLHDLYFDEQSAINTGNVIAKSRAALAGSGIDMAAWSTCATDESSSTYQAAASGVDTQMALGEEYGVRGTPGFFVNGRFVNGNQPMDVFVSAIEAAKQDPR